MAQHNSAKGKIIGAIVVIVIVGVAAWWYFTRVPGVDFSHHGPAANAPAATATAPLPPRHPISEAQAGPAPASTAPPLPPLNQSDHEVVSALGKIPGAHGLERMLVTRALIPHVVATVLALNEDAPLGSTILPMRTPSGTFTAVKNKDGQPALTAKDFARYDRYMKIIKNVNSRTLVTWYVHWYPLFQQAYRQLGYPHGYFNDQLIRTIDDMLAAPNAEPPVALIKTQNDRYEFADPTWQSLSAGQKLMIRMGPDHERTVKAKLRRIRALLLGKAAVLKQAAAPASSASAAPASTTH